MHTQTMSAISAKSMEALGQYTTSIDPNTKKKYLRVAPVTSKIYGAYCVVDMETAAVIASFNRNEITVLPVYITEEALKEFGVKFSWTSNGCFLNFGKHTAKILDIVIVEMVNNVGDIAKTLVIKTNTGYFNKSHPELNKFYVKPN